MTVLPCHEAEACRQLWVAVLARGVSDAIAAPKGNGFADRDIVEWRARSWIGSSSFREVCMLTGVCPDRLEAKVRTLIEKPPVKTTAGRTASLRWNVQREVAA